MIWTQPSGPLCLWQCFLLLSGKSWSWAFANIWIIQHLVQIVRSAWHLFGWILQGRYERFSLFKCMSVFFFKLDSLGIERWAICRWAVIIWSNFSSSFHLLSTKSKKILWFVESTSPKWTLQGVSKKVLFWNHLVRIVFQLCRSYWMSMSGT